MRTWTVRIVIALVLILVAAQAIPVGGNNPPVDPSKTLTASVPVPPDVSAALRRSCQDCHSNQTTWPWYSRVAPVSWLIANHVSTGRSELNLSEWAQYQARRKDRKLKEICEQVQKDRMPMYSYTILHPDAKLSQQEKSSICQWTNAARQQLAVASAQASRR